MSDLRPNVFTLIGLFLAFATLALFVCAIVGSTANISVIKDFGPIGIFTLLGGGLFLWIGGVDQVSAR